MWVDWPVRERKHESRPRLVGVWRARYEGPDEHPIHLVGVPHIESQLRVELNRPADIGDMGICPETGEICQEPIIARHATKIASMSDSHASLTDIPAADVAHTDAKWTPVRNHFGITAFGVNAYTARNAGDRLIGEHDHADPTDEQHQELYFVHTGHARFRVDGQDVDAPAGTFVSALDVKTIRSAVALSDNTVVLVIGAEPGAPYEITPAERAELAAAGLPATPA